MTKSGCKGCGGAKHVTGHGKETREILDVLYDRGNIDGGRAQRWHICMTANKCGLACPDMDKLAGEIPTCPGSRNLYEDLKLRRFKCPRGRF